MLHFLHFTFHYFTQQIETIFSFSLSKWQFSMISLTLQKVKKAEFNGDDDVVGWCFCTNNHKQFHLYMIYIGQNQSQNNKMVQEL